MRAALVMADVLATSDDHSEALGQLRQAGLLPVVIALGADDIEVARAAGAPSIECPAERPSCWDESVALLQLAASRADAVPAESFLICSDPADVDHARAQGCRPILVLGDRTFDEVYGLGEPEDKGASAAIDLDTAIRYALEEAQQHQDIGPFPYAAPPVEGQVRTVLPRRQDLAVVFGLVTVAGIAVALGVAYLLQEIYQTMRFPAIAYYLTLQFIDQTWRGVLFLIIGGVLGALVAVILPRVVFRQRAGGV
ncbi:MAG: hypothetical protein ACK2T6_07500 [Anaerolineae bacterium]